MWGYVGFLRVLRFPPTLQKNPWLVDGILKIVPRSDCECKWLFIRVPCNWVETSSGCTAARRRLEQSPTRPQPSQEQADKIMDGWILLEMLNIEYC